MKFQFEDLERRVINWARERKIIQNASSTSQLLKMFSEAGELCDAHNKRRKDEVKDAVGDMVVCLINYCEIEGILLVDCLGHAYMQIKDRKGTLLPTGIFLKEGDV